MVGAGDDFRARVLEATDLVELIGRSVKLVRRGRDFVGLCPFHQEKSPSFYVKPEKQYFHCFGCKASGTAFDFVMKRDRVEFKDALLTLAKAANIELPHWAGGSANSSQRQVLLEIQNAAASHFEKQLAHPQIGGPAREYLGKRGFNGETIKRFRIGLAPDGWEHLLRSPEMRKFQPPQLALAGVVKTRDSGGFYDTFRNRLMFPIRDEGGRIIGFGGRVMPGSEDPAKYLNSPETPLFSKSRIAFGLDLARQKIVESRTVAVVEGYTDVMMAHQYGASNVVSVLGTAMTAQHVSLLRRFADRIVLLFDADLAGDAAADRAVELFLTQPVEVAIASMPDGVDPDEYLLANGADGFAKLIGGAADALSYKWKQLNRRFDSEGAGITGQQKAVQAYLDVLAGARGSGPIDVLRWGAALTQVSRLTGIPVEDLNARFRTTRQPASRSGGGSASGRPGGPSGRAERRQPRMGAELGMGAGMNGNPAQRWILATLLAEPGRWHDVQTQVHVEDFEPGVVRDLADIYWTYQRDEGEPLFQELLAALPEPSLRSVAIDLMNEYESQAGDAKPRRDKALADSIAAILWQRTEVERRHRQAMLTEGSGRRGDDAVGGAGISGDGMVDAGMDDAGVNDAGVVDAAIGGKNESGQANGAKSGGGVDEIEQLIRLTELSRAASARNRNF